MPTHIKPVLSSNDSISLINIFLLVIFVPIIVGIIFKILSVTKYEEEGRYIERAWKFSFGSFLYYGLLFLAYGELASLALNFRYFKAEVSAILGMIVGIVFAALLTIWVIASVKYPLWFGSFKKKFFKFEISQYFYIFSSI